MARKKHSLKYILEHYECEGQLEFADIPDYIPPLDRFTECYDEGVLFDNMNPDELFKEHLTVIGRRFYV